MEERRLFEQRLVALRTEKEELATLLQAVTKTFERPHSCKLMRLVSTSRFPQMKRHERESTWCGRLRRCGVDASDPPYKFTLTSRIEQWSTRLFGCSLEPHGSMVPGGARSSSSLESLCSVALRSVMEEAAKSHAVKMRQMQQGRATAFLS
eukprot:214379-Amphidinium_carterae.1